MTDGTASDSRRPRPVWVQLSALVFAALLVLIQLYVAIPLAPVVADALVIDGTSAALGTSYSLAYAVGFLIWGPLSDRYGRKAILVPGLLALAVATAVLAVVSTLPALAALRAVQGLLASCFPAAALAYVVEAFPQSARAPGIGAISTAFLVAGILGQVYAQGVASALGWQWVFLLGAPALFLAALAIAAVIDRRSNEVTPLPLSETYRSLVTLARRRELISVYLAALTVLGSFVAMYATLGPLLLDRYALEGTDVLFVRLAGLPAMMLSPLAGRLIGRIGPRRVTAAGFVLAAVGLAAEGLAAGLLAALVAASVIFVAGIAVVVPGIIALVGELAGVARGSAIGTLGLSLFVGASVGALAPDLRIEFSNLAFLLVLLLFGAAVLITRSKPAQL
ncbi:MAG: MFS transporter [Acidimicrobiia bacterium]